MQRPVSPGWGFDARLTTLFFKKIAVAKSKEVKTGWSNSRRIRQVWQNF
jgi:hypothetical protein